MDDPAAAAVVVEPVPLVSVDPPVVAEDAPLAEDVLEAELAEAESELEAASSA